MEVQDAEGKPLPGMTLDDADYLIGDEIARTVTWRGVGDVGSLRRSPVRLRLVMRDADLYSLKFE